jgi:2-polyprenyl-3-methyl-5-hydroxy-6-metoxy-1,4-benzoquinol methylase
MVAFRLTMEVNKKFGFIHSTSVLEHVKEPERIVEMVADIVREADTCYKLERSLEISMISKIDRVEITWPPLWRVNSLGRLVRYI